MPRQASPGGKLLTVSSSRKSRHHLEIIFNPNSIEFCLNLESLN